MQTPLAGPGTLGSCKLGGLREGTEGPESETGRNKDSLPEQCPHLMWSGSPGAGQGGKESSRT